MKENSKYLSDARILLGIQSAVRRSCVAIAAMNEGSIDTCFERVKDAVHVLSPGSLCIYTNCVIMMNAILKDSEESTAAKIDKEIIEYMHYAQRIQRGEYAYGCEFDQTTETHIDFVSTELEYDTLSPVNDSIKNEVVEKTH